MPIQSLCRSTILLLLIGEENDDVAGGDNISPFPVLAGASSGESPGRANKQMRNNDRYVEIVWKLFGKQGEALLSHGNSLETKDIIILQKHGRFRPCGWDLQELGEITRICPKSFPFTISLLLEAVVLVNKATAPIMIGTSVSLITCYRGIYR